MSSSQPDRSGLRLAAGIAVILIGLALMTRAIDLFDSVSLDELWPAIVLAVGIAILTGAHEPRKRRQGLLLVFLSLWFFVNTLGIGGLDWGTSWPLAILAVGGARLIAETSPRGRAWGGLLILVGLWLQVSILGVWGLDLEDSWPVALVLGGLWLVATSFGLGRSRTGKDEHES